MRVAPTVVDGRTRRWDQHKAERRRLVLSAALEAIEEAGPGVEVHVQQIAERAGLSRTVLYRHFVDRADLDRAAQGAIVAELWSEIEPALSLDGTPAEVVRRIVAAFAGWAAAHPAWHRFVEREVPGEGVQPLPHLVELLSAQVEQLLTEGAALLGVPLDEELCTGLDPLVTGMVAGTMAAVRRWLTRPGPALALDDLVELLTQSLTGQIAGLAAARGVVIDPDQPLQDLFPRA